MSYEKQTWANGDVITANKLNHIENGIDAIVEMELDDTLSVAGKAADAKTVGDEIGDLKIAFENETGSSTSSSVTEDSTHGSMAIEGATSLTEIDILADSGITTAWAVIADGSNNLLPYMSDLHTSGLGLDIDAIGNGGYRIHGTTTGKGNAYINRSGAFAPVYISKGNGTTDRMYVAINNTAQAGLAVTYWHGTSDSVSLSCATANYTNSIKDALSGKYFDGIQIYVSADIGTEIDMTFYPVITVGISDTTYKPMATVTKLDAVVESGAKATITSGLPSISDNVLIYTYSDASSYTVTTEYEIEELTATTLYPLRLKKILIIGDSISTDSYGNYKKWVTDLIEKGILSESCVTNNSVHATGYLAIYDSGNNTFMDRLTAVADKSTYDMVVIFGGTNDYIQNIPMGTESGDATAEFAAAVKALFEYLIENFTQAKICIISPLRTYATWVNTQNLYETDYFSKIREIAKEYCFPILNLTEESGFCPYITTFRNMWTLLPSGQTDHDGVHPTEEYESKYLAPMIKGFLENLIA